VARALRRLLIGLGVIGLIAILAAVGMLIWGAQRVRSYEQKDDPGALSRKSIELSRMTADAQSMVAERPNLVVILFDDLGYGDIGAFGGHALETPRMDALASEGIALDHYYAAAPVCTPSRAGLLTGRWPIRTGLPHVVFPSGHPIDSAMRAAGTNVRLPADEITLAEALRAGGYATALVGKWHLGDHAPSLPRDLGFDRFVGLLYSNDMSPLPLWRDEEILEPDPVDQTRLTPRYTREAIHFIEASRDRPFFLYMAHSFPHIPLHATPQQAGRSQAGLYGDVVADLDESVGAILDALDRLQLSERTLVIVTSDNGPWFQGSPGGIRGRKGGTFEGGMRVPFIARWPGRIPPGTRSDAVAAAIDVFPTALALAGVPLPEDRLIDGVDMMPALLGSGALPERPIFYYDADELQAMRVGRFKWQARRGIAYGRLPRLDLSPLFPVGPWLFDLERDPDESYDVSALHAADMARLEAIVRAHQAEIGADARGWRR
jgi:arylsulfatase A-like enzyme